ncbi:Methyltransferase domain-containing protein [Dyella jiangningensis]|uniref:class I SAM-dependent methyltransferase n=1 Tax=Dyella sp. AtDHG13 TaxID=1938897 RepID=UPI0008904F34|nr:class I SAM-dependent methyltransferase [Dyella sp. AtDHG13]PXV57186.1 methyltransferase family protein [Dyella sp. AtDHG13]SDL56365.1 Methyltransferase domain-containing protein [Dyella jiangningensis]
MPTLAIPRPSEAELKRTNQVFYDGLWSGARLVDPARFNTWPMVRDLAMALPRRLEIAPGLRPRLPLDGTYFVDISQAALHALREHGVSAVRASISALPCPDASFDLVCALDILEHVRDDEGALRELTRVAAPQARLLLSVPLHESAWTAFDEFVGHYRRYEPAQIVERLAAHGWMVEQSAIYGMQPTSTTLLNLGQWYLSHQRERAMWWYNRVIMPLGLRLQKPLRWQPGLPSSEGVDEVLLLCRRA